jgi:hypothetical protein
MNIRPSLQLNFARARALDPRITFIRASTGTYYDRYGKVKSAAENEPRFDHNPATGKSLGLLMEEPRTNLLTYSAIGPAGTGWTATGTSSRTYSQIDPMGGTDAVLFDDTDAAVISYLRQTPTIPNDSATYTASVFAKAGTTGKLYMRLALTGGTTPPFGACIFDFTSKTWTLAGSVYQGGYTELTDGWFRLWLQIDNNSTGNVTFDYRIGATDTSVGSTGTVYLWGAQIETGTFLTSYIPTTTATVTRSGDQAYMTDLSWYNHNEGTFAINANVPQSGSLSAAYFASMSNTVALSATNRIQMNVSTAGEASLSTVSGGTVQVAGIQPTGLDLTFEAAFALGVNDCVAVDQGRFSGVNSSCIQPAGLVYLNIGTSTARTLQLNGTIERLTYFRQRLPSGDLTTLTT